MSSSEEWHHGMRMVRIEVLKLNEGMQRVTEAGDPDSNPHHFLPIEQLSYSTMGTVWDKIGPMGRQSGPR
eukprot:2486376-Amphidinium_carterae.1